MQLSTNETIILKTFISPNRKTRNTLSYKEIHDKVSSKLLHDDSEKHCCYIVNHLIQLNYKRIGNASISVTSLGVNELDRYENSINDRTKISMRTALTTFFLILVEGAFSRLLPFF
ncbi:hypothetical protein B8A41_04425 [Dolosigranulum pigrum]|uniref:hypothetical protein n=1 Tax=Dolosigranulum pigrum TaxID=29394 RepID=UPI00155DF2C2|nr:hypothetical protein [Dolosigranulum pigrum]QJS97878.1 hypothetical protein B8A41_04425 [Dolosigranulum pigrum]